MFKFLTAQTRQQKNHSRHLSTLLYRCSQPAIARFNQKPVALCISIIKMKRVGGQQKYQYSQGKFPERPANGWDLISVDSDTGKILYLHISNKPY